MSKTKKGVAAADGGAEIREGTLYTRNLILRSFCAIYLIAFLSFYHQSAGLFGNNGVLPARTQIDSTGGSAKLKVSAIQQKPTLLHLSSFLGIDTGYMVDLLALVGAIISFTGFISQTFCILPTFAALWSLYYSLVQVAQTFTNQSDLLLLEAGFIILILAPLNSPKKRSPTDNIGLVMLRWLLFRFMFASGAVKLASGCPYWWNLTALGQHFETMPLPTPLSWYAFHLPETFLKLNVIFANLTELVCPWLFFFPNRVVRRFAFYWQVFLQFNIIITGNYGFLNFLIVTLLFSLLDDTHFFEKKTKTKDIFGIIFTIFILGGVLAGTYHFYGISIINGEISAKIAFTKQQYLEMLKIMIKASPLLASVTLISTFLSTLVTHPAITQVQSLFKKIIPALNLLLFTTISIVLIGISIVPHSNLQSSTNVTNTQLGQTYRNFKHLNIVNEYGQHLRKMRSERLEIILEHANNIEGPWVEYGFQYKPWNVNHSLPFSGPYLPRLDFKFWNAAVNNYNDELWLSSLAYRLLQNDKYALQLLGIRTPLQTAPKFVRGSLYSFKYTSWNERNNPAYWMRQRVGEYFPAYSLDHGPLLAFLKNMKISPTYKSPPVRNEILKNILDFIRNKSFLVEGSLILFGVLSAGFALIATSSRQ